MSWTCLKAELLQKRSGSAAHCLADRTSRQTCQNASPVSTTTCRHVCRIDWKAATDIERPDKASFYSMSCSRCCATMYLLLVMQWFSAADAWTTLLLLLYRKLHRHGLAGTMHVRQRRYRFESTASSLCAIFCLQMLAALQPSRCRRLWRIDSLNMLNQQTYVTRCVTLPCRHERSRGRGCCQ